VKNMNKKLIGGAAAGTILAGTAMYMGMRKAKHPRKAGRKAKA
jgi:hypothetical protein